MLENLCHIPNLDEAVLEALSPSSGTTLSSFMFNLSPLPTHLVQSKTKNGRVNCTFSGVDR